MRPELQRIMKEAEALDAAKFTQISRADEASL
jgi:hypothetical protein